MSFSTEQPTAGEKPRHAFTVDLEDWYQSSVDSSAPITDRVIRNTHILLGFLDEFNVKATFFTQGKVAETFPGLIREIQKLGHEIQSHGYAHIPLHLLDVSSFRADLTRSIKILEDITGQKVTTFRAPDFSINTQNLWALDVLAESEIRVDSSIFPMKTWRYGISHSPIQPYKLTTPQGYPLLEVPVAIWILGRRRVPISGGGYLRLLPYLLIQRGMRAIEQEGRPAVVYCHPYEFVPEEVDEYAGQVNPFFAFYQKSGRRRFIRRLRRLLHDFKFGRLDRCLEVWQANNSLTSIT
jgi:polysaccharide deacetylase family protein (PEP-CTERM system associated)